MPIDSLLKDIMQSIAKQFFLTCQAIKQWKTEGRDALTPYADAFMDRRLAVARTLSANVSSVSPDDMQATVMVSRRSGGSTEYKVVLNASTGITKCPCLRPVSDDAPCIHGLKGMMAVQASVVMKLPWSPKSLHWYSDVYRMSTLYAQYRVPPPAATTVLQLADDPSMLPPHGVKKAGRPKKKRIKSTGEHAVAGVVASRAKERAVRRARGALEQQQQATLSLSDNNHRRQRCSRCGATDHNARKCPACDSIFMAKKHKKAIDDKVIDLTSD
jgi:hypothetical protein